MLPFKLNDSVFFYGIFFFIVDALLSDHFIMCVVELLTTEMFVKWSIFFCSYVFMRFYLNNLGDSDSKWSLLFPPVKQCDLKKKVFILFILYHPHVFEFFFPASHYFFFFAVDLLSFDLVFFSSNVLLKW